MAGHIVKCLVMTVSFCVCLRTNVFAANILISAIYGEGSHFLAASKVGASLVQRGHNVTFLISNAYEHRVSDPKLSKFSFEVFKHPVPKEEVLALLYKANTLVFSEDTSDFLGLLANGSQRMVDDCEAVVSDRDLLSRLELIDAIIVDITWPCAHYIKAALETHQQSTRHRTMISFSPTSPWPGFMRFVGSPVNYAYQPELTTGFTDRMSFKERVLNVITSFLIPFIGNWISTTRYQKMGKKLGLSQNIHPIHTFRDFDLHLINTDISNNYPMPLMPNIIRVGGLSAGPVEPLSKELEQFVQSSGEHGVVVFTLGTYLSSITTFRPEIVDMFAEAFRKIPQKVIWQLKELPNYELPPNVKTMPWIPQNDLLGHPKSRAFMYQGGNNGFQEASYHGVPVVVIPLHGDQFDVATRIESLGMGKRMDKLELSADLIYETLTEVINTTSYTTLAKKVSAINQDQPMRAPDRAAFWVEHVIKFGGEYMRSPANELNFFQYHLLDVTAFLTTIVVVVLLTVLYILRFCLRKCWRMIGGGSSSKPKKD